MKKLLFLYFVSLSSFCSLSQSSPSAMNILHSSVQASCTNEVNRANYYFGTMKDNVMAARGLNYSEKRIANLEMILARMEEIQKRTHTVIDYLDSLKLYLLEKEGYNVNLSRSGSNSLIGKVSDMPCRPIELNLNDFEGTEMSTSYNKKELGQTLVKYRSGLLRLIGQFEMKGRKYRYRDFTLPSWESMDQLRQLVRDSLIAQKTLMMEDPYCMAEVYTRLSYFEEYGAPMLRGTLLEKISTITCMQYNILNAYVMSMAHWQSRVGVNELLFNELQAICSAPNSAQQGENIELDIKAVAYDAINAPLVSIETIEGTSDVQSTDGKVNLVMGDSDVYLKGTVQVMTKMGRTLTLPWEVKILHRD